MIPWTLIERVPSADGRSEMSLHQRGEEFSIRVSGIELMNSRRYESEERMSVLAREALGDTRAVRVLIAGLGMGYTLRAALRAWPKDARIEVAELMPAVVAWNRGPLGPLAGHPLRDPRVQVCEGDVCDLLRGVTNRYDAVLLDVDNGPGGLTQDSNQWLYEREGLACIHRALGPRGVLVVWSAGTDARFTKRLRSAGFEAKEHRVNARAGGGGRHHLWVGVRRGGPD